MPTEYYVPKIFLEHRWLVEYWLVRNERTGERRHTPAGVWYQKEWCNVDAFYPEPYESMGDWQNSGGSATQRAREQLALVHPANLQHPWLLHGFLLEGQGPVIRKGVYVSEIFDSWPMLMVDVIWGKNYVPKWRMTEPYIDPVRYKLGEHMFKPETWAFEHEPDDEHDFSYWNRRHLKGLSRRP